MLILSAPLTGNDSCPWNKFCYLAIWLFGHFKSDRRTFACDELLSTRPLNTEHFFPLSLPLSL